MKVERSRSIGSSGVVKGGKAKASGDFAGTLRAEAEQAAAPVSAPQVLTGIDALFALQEVPDATAERSRALARGDQMLERLEELKRGLLLGHIGRDRLADLARLAREGSEKLADPNVREVLQEIELRAKVELAKLQPQEDA